jgi:hypothetical protein
MPLRYGGYYDVTISLLGVQNDGHSLQKLMLRHGIFGVKLVEIGNILSGQNICGATSVLQSEGRVKNKNSALEFQRINGTLSIYKHILQARILELWSRLAFRVQGDQIYIS